MTKNKAASLLLNQTKKPLEDNFNFEEWMHQITRSLKGFSEKTPNNTTGYTSQLLTIIQMVK